MTVESIATLFVAMLISAAVPGPGVLTCIARAIASGFQAALYIIAGIVLGNAAFLVVVLLGLAAAASALGGLFIAIKYLGALYVIWLGLRLWLAEVTTDDLDRQVASASPVSGFLTGLVVPFSNSAVIFFYVSLLPTFIDVNHLGWVDGFTAILVISAALFMVLAAYSYGATRARGLLRDRRARRRCNQGAGALMVGTGVYIAIRQT
jgi:threonine/homoserine/homoserine lactone efflux protein